MLTQKRKTGFRVLSVLSFTETRIAIDIVFQGRYIRKKGTQTKMALVAEP